MGVFDKMAEAQPTGASRWFQEGSYLCRVRRCQHFLSAQGKGNGVAIEVGILETTLAYEAGRRSWVDGSELAASNSPGEVCSTVLWLDRQQPAMGNLKGFLLAATRLSEDQIIQAHAEAHGLDLDDPRTAQGAWAAFAEQCCGGAGEALAGVVVGCRATLTKTKSGSPFTKVVWETASDADVAHYTAGDAAAGAA